MNTKVIRISFILFVLFSSLSLNAQSSGAYDDNPFEEKEPNEENLNSAYDWSWKTSSIPSTPPPPPVPIDSGLGFLLAAGAGYGLKRLRNRKGHQA